ncbi:small integral membrane protein 20 isoform 2-T5 [Podargus strigoides]
MAGLSRTIGIFGGFVAVVGAALYPIFFRPLLLPEQYKKEQSINRAGIVQEDIQPAALHYGTQHFKDHCRIVYVMKNVCTLKYEQQI